MVTKKHARLMRLAVGIVVITGLAAIGCQGAKHPLVPVKGKVVFEDGQPLPAGTRLILEPVEPDRMPAMAELGAGGTFIVKHSAGNFGAEVGRYRVRLAAPAKEPQGFFQVVPESYGEGSELFLEVKPNLGEVTFKVRRKNPT